MVPVSTCGLVAPDVLATAKAGAWCDRPVKKAEYGNGGTSWETLDGATGTKADRRSLTAVDPREEEWVCEVSIFVTSRGDERGVQYDFLVEVLTLRSVGSIFSDL